MAERSTVADPLSVLWRWLAFGWRWNALGGVLFVVLSLMWGVAVGGTPDSFEGLALFSGIVLVLMLVAVVPAVLAVWAFYLLVRALAQDRVTTIMAVVAPAVVVVGFMVPLTMTDSLRLDVIQFWGVFMAWGSLGAWLGVRRVFR